MDSWFNGREPDEFRWNIETRKFDSWSTRLSYNPLPELSMQVSYGDLKCPEQLEPDTRVKRTTASITHHLKRDDNNWATTIAYGRNKKTGPALDISEPGWLLESTYVLRDTHTFFARAEQVDNNELFQERLARAGVPEPQVLDWLHLRLRQYRTRQMGHWWPGGLSQWACATRAVLRQ